MELSSLVVAGGYSTFPETWCYRFVPRFIGARRRDRSVLRSARSPKFISATLEVTSCVACWLR